MKRVGITIAAAATLGIGLGAGGHLLGSHLARGGSVQALMRGQTVAHVGAASALPASTIAGLAGGFIMTE